MKISNCSICGSSAESTYLDIGSKGTLYGVKCGGGHSIAAAFGTKNRAIQAWNECQEFVERYTVWEDDLK